MDWVHSPSQSVVAGSTQKRAHDGDQSSGEDDANELPKAKQKVNDDTLQNGAIFPDSNAWAFRKSQATVDDSDEETSSERETENQGDTATDDGGIESEEEEDVLYMVEARGMQKKIPVYKVLLFG